MASCLINILMLTGSIFMMQVYDRVLASQSVPTLVILAAIAASAYLFQGLLDLLRARILALVAEAVDASLAPRLHAALASLPLIPGRAQSESLQPFRDLEAIRSFIAGQGPQALFDLPWMPIYLIVLFVLHPVLGWVTTASAIVLVALAGLTEILSRKPLLEAVA
ncbi:MAG: type I secretion system permease/ATPase, partial [Proteobacteria bacterium]|nr:type I secretion system permease/ATPase [Pseudomonadota bacterium]